MAGTKTPADKQRLDRVLAEARRYREARAKTYREQALKLLPWICGRCGREFSGARLRELTVHHRDHNHDNNPPDGSTWELLCIYCHEDEHRRELEALANPDSRSDHFDAATQKPFANLKKLMSGKP